MRFTGPRRHRLPPFLPPRHTGSAANRHLLTSALHLPERRRVTRHRGDLLQDGGLVETDPRYTDARRLPHCRRVDACVPLR